jgi:hypothetical protein
MTMSKAEIQGGFTCERGPLDDHEKALQDWAGEGWNWWHSGGGCWLLEKDQRHGIKGIKGSCYFLISPSEMRSDAGSIGAYLDNDAGDDMVAWLPDIVFHHTTIDQAMEEIMNGQHPLKD